MAQSPGDLDTGAGARMHERGHGQRSAVLQRCIARGFGRVLSNDHEAGNFMITARAIHAGWPGRPRMDFAIYLPSQGVTWPIRERG